MVVVCGMVFGMSKYDVTPPNAAALLSLSISAFSVKPGSLKCTCSSMTPGITMQSVALITLSKSF